MPSSRRYFTSLSNRCPHKISLGKYDVLACNHTSVTYKLSSYTFICLLVWFHLLPRDATQSAVLPQQVVRSSVTLMYCGGHTDWNTSKIISRLIIAYRVFALCRPRHHRSTPENTPNFEAEIGVESWKSGSRRTQPAMSLKRLQRKLLLSTYIKSRTICRLVPQYDLFHACILGIDINLQQHRAVASAIAWLSRSYFTTSSVLVALI